MEKTQANFRELIKRDLTLFTEQVALTVSPAVNFQPNWHIELIAEYLEACQRGDIRRLIINIPPRHLKSISVNVAFPAWLLAHDPTQQIMCASYGQRLSEKHHMDCRLVMQQQWYRDLFPHVQLSDDQNTKSKFVTSARGHRISTSVGGAATGEGANFLIMDDPVKADDATSDTIRESANVWFDQTFSTRLNDKKTGCIIIIMQRLHEQDLTGHLLEKGGWEHLCLPMVAEKDELLKCGYYEHPRKTGDLLHPERIGEKEIHDLKIELGAYGYSGQYQQRPSPEGGGEFRKEWIQYYDKLAPHTLNYYIFVDPANSKTKDSDYTAMVVMGAGGDGNLYLVDIVRDRLNVREREEKLFELHKKYKPKSVVYEKYGMQCDADWLREAMADRNYRFHLQEIGGRLSKTDRIKRLVPYFADRKIYLPKVLFKVNHKNQAIDVIDEFVIQEYCTFPVGIHDDLLDAMSRLCDITIQYPGHNTINYYELYGENKVGAI